MNNKCGNCYFWSSLIAQSVGCGPVKAMCLNDKSDNHEKMTKSNTSCFHWVDGTKELVDDI